MTALEAVAANLTRNRRPLAGDDDDPAGEEAVDDGRPQPLDSWLFKLSGTQARKVGKLMRASLARPYIWVDSRVTPPTTVHGPSPYQIFDDEQSPYHEAFTRWVMSAAREGLAQSTTGRMKVDHLVERVRRFDPFGAPKGGAHGQGKSGRDTSKPLEPDYSYRP